VSGDNQVATYPAYLIDTARKWELTTRQMADVGHCLRIMIGVGCRGLWRLLPPDPEVADGLARIERDRELVRTGRVPTLPPHAGVVVRPEPCNDRRRWQLRGTGV